MQNIFIVGASGHASVVIDIVEKRNSYHIAGLIDTHVPVNSEFLGFAVLGSEEDLPLLLTRHDVGGGVVAIGDNFIRHKVVQRILNFAPGFVFVTAVHPSAQIARGVTIGAGTVVTAGAVINTNSRIGRHCIVNTNASVDHDNVMEDFISVGPGATTGGNVHLGEFGVLAQRANVIHGIRIGAHAVVGAGSTALKDIPDFVVAYGSPARVIRTRKAGEKYL